MNVFDIQTELAARALYSGKVDGIYGPKTDRAVEAYLANQRVKAAPTWGDARQQIAAMQAICRERGIEVGDVDGLMGPQTRHAFEVYDARKANGWQKVAAVEEWRGATDEATKPSQPTRPVVLLSNVPRVKSPRQSRVPEFYGAPGDSRLQTTLRLPYPQRLAWDLDTVVRSYSCHKLVHDAMEYVWEATLSHYGADGVKDLRLDLFGGCLNVRRMRGGTSWSMHSWGIAEDVDPDHNALKMTRKQATLDDPVYDPFWSFVYSTGAISLGRERDYDWMHWQYAVL